MATATDMKKAMIMSKHLGFSRASGVVITAVIGQVFLVDGLERIRFLE